MNLQDLWSGLEREAAASSRRGILRRRLAPDAACDLFIGVEHAAVPIRMLIIRVARGSIGDHGQLPETKGCELNIRQLPEDPADRESFCLSLLDRRFADVFTSLAADIVEHLRQLRGDAAIAEGLIGRLAHWQRFFDRLPPEGLGPEPQRGLFGELWFLQHHLIPDIGHQAAVTAWTGPHRTPHDFQLPVLSVEVKTTIIKQHVKIEITSERQLDDTHTPGLLLFHLSLDAGAAGLSLVELVAQVRATLEGHSCREMFDDLLIEGGYLNIHEDRYREPHYHIRASHLFRVQEGFPRLIERDLPAGVGDLRYSVLLASCMNSAIIESQWPDILRGVDHE